MTETEAGLMDTIPHKVIERMEARMAEKERKLAFAERAAPALRQARTVLATLKGERGAGLLLYEIDAALSLLDRVEP